MSGVKAILSLSFSKERVESMKVLMLNGSAKKEGNNEGIRTAGFVLSLIALIGGAIAFLACAACIGAFGTALQGEL